MGKLKTFEEYEYSPHGDKVWIIGIPSGEALQVSIDSIEDLYRNKLIHYSVKYVNIGFYAFHDKDIDEIIKYVELEKKLPGVNKKDKDITILKNNYDPILMNSIIAIIDEYPTPIELYAQNKCIGITYADDYYIEIDLDKSSNNKYRIMKRYNGRVINKYFISTDKELIDKIEQELYHYNQL
jgi:hypothetical protein